MKLSAEQINRAITGFTEVVELKVEADPSSGKYELTLVLQAVDRKTVVLKGKDISNFGLSNFGGGLMQFCPFELKMSGRDSSIGFLFILQIRKGHRSSLIARM